MAVYRKVLELGFDCQVLTKGPKSQSRAWAEKVVWCQRHLGPDVDIHVVSDKLLNSGVRVRHDGFPPPGVTSCSDACLGKRRRGTVPAHVSIQSP